MIGIPASCEDSCDPKLRSGVEADVVSPERAEGRQAPSPGRPLRAMAPAPLLHPYGFSRLPHGAKADGVGPNPSEGRRG